MGDDLLSKLSEYVGAEDIAEADKKVSVIVFINSIDATNNTPFWSFVAVLPSKLAEFHRVQASGEVFFVDDYGEILYTGEGNVPPVEVVKDLQERYGIDVKFHEKMINEAKTFITNKEEEKKTNFLMDKINQMKAKKEGE